MVRGKSGRVVVVARKDSSPAQVRTTGTTLAIATGPPGNPLGTVGYRGWGWVPCAEGAIPDIQLELETNAPSLE